MVYSLLTDKEAILQTYRNFHNQREDKKHYTIKLTCGHNIEVTKGEDQYIECSFCHKKYLLTHSALTNRLYSE